MNREPGQSFLNHHLAVTFILITSVIIFFLLTSSSYLLTQALASTHHINSVVIEPFGAFSEQNITYIDDIVYKNIIVVTRER